MTIDKHTGLVLEGGGLRGVFTCGVLDCFMESDFRLLSRRNALYNRSMELVERLEDEDRIIIIRPVRPIDVGRMEKDTDKLRALYGEGYSEAEKMLSDIKTMNEE